ncbi:hypothetical protein H6G35_00430 [Aulosira sp. FACHB-113]|nr:hypothetical protein [Aulosira sp. FACHB-113]
MRENTAIAYNNVSIPNFRHKSPYLWRGIALLKAEDKTLLPHAQKTL